MSKLKALSNAIKNPPPDRLAKIEYRSHLLQGIGITAVCIILIFKGFWYIIFALIFGVGVSYTQGVSAYQKYKILATLRPKEKVEDYKKDISPSRKRSKIVQHVFGNKTPYFVGSASIITTLFFIDPTVSRLQLSLTYPFLAVLIYVLLYFFFLYWIARPMYESEIKLSKDESEGERQLGR